MSALFDEPVRGKFEGKQVMIVGIIDPDTDHRGLAKLLINHADGQLGLADIGLVKTLWRYGVIPTGPRKGEIGWWDDIPEDEEQVNPIDVDDDGA
jgi:hypothetical protein